MSAAALEEYCGSTFWNASYLDSETPDLPVCLEQTVLVWIPLSFLWLCAPLHLVGLCKRTNVNLKYLSKLYICKQLVTGLLLLAAVAALAVTLGEDFGPGKDPNTANNAGVYYANPVVYIVSWIVIMLCQEAVRRRRAVDSSTLFLFWLLQIFCHVFPFQTLLRAALKQGEVMDVPRFCLFYITFALEVCAFILSAIADVPPEALERVKRNPEEGAAFLSRITFNWFNSMVITGYKRPLVQKDMWDLNEADSTPYINREFQSNMMIELTAAQVTQHQRRQKKSDQLRDIDETLQNGNGLGNSVSQNGLMMVRGKIFT